MHRHLPGVQRHNFSQTILLSLALLTVFACMVMTAKSENHSVVIVLRSQVYVWIRLRIGENDLIRSPWVKQREFLEVLSRLRRRCCPPVLPIVRTPRWIRNPTLPDASTGSSSKTVNSLSKDDGNGIRWPHFLCST